MTNILFCVDVSGSMGMPFGAGTRYDASMKAIESFIDRRSGDAFGLQFFGNSAIRWTPLTTDPFCDQSVPCPSCVRMSSQFGWQGPQSERRCWNARRGLARTTRGVTGW
jgi:hypothetical protein